MNLLRKIKISKITNNIILTGVDKEVFDFINSKLEDLIPFQMDGEPDSIYYMNSKGDWILEQNNKKNILGVRYMRFWNILEQKYFMKYVDIQRLLKYMIEQSFKQKDSSTICDVWKSENVFKLNGLSIPEYYSGTWYSLIEEAFKQKLSIPQSGITGNKISIEIEEAFKQKLNEFNTQA